jgi:integrase
MALYKRNKTWHTHFFVDGQRYRQSLHTCNYREAQHEEKRLISQAEQGKLAPTGQITKLGFDEAAERYLGGRKLELSESSLKKERHLLVPSRHFFRSDALSRITTDRLLAFRERRSEQNVGPATINMEMGVIRRILKRAKRWHLVGGDLKPLKERRSVGRAMTLDEKLRLLRLAAQNPDWQNTRLAMTLALNTTMRGCELKSLRWRDVDMMGRVLTIMKSKTEAGERVIPLNSTAFAAILDLRDRAKSFNGLDPNHYLFPACENQVIDPTKPQKSWRTTWRRLTRAIECPKCGQFQAPAQDCRNQECKADIHDLRSSTAGLRFHDLRHHAITELAESQASDQTIMAIAGHVSPKMLAHYSHVRLAAKRDALEALATASARCIHSRGEPGHVDSSATSNHEAVHDTTYDTREIKTGKMLTEQLEKNGRPEWTRTIDLFRVKEAL